MATTSSACVEEILEDVKKRTGFVPNVLTEMSVSPALLSAYIGGQTAMGKATLSAEEQQAVEIAVSQVSHCDYCATAHGAIGMSAGIDPADVEAIKGGGLPGDEGLANLVSATRMVYEKKGYLDSADISTLEVQGIDRERLFEIIALIALKTMTNYVNHISKTELDAAFGG